MNFKAQVRKDRPLADTVSSSVCGDGERRQLAGASQQKLELGRLRQVPFAGECHGNVAESDECAQCCTCFTADETKPSTEEKLLELGFQPDRTGTIGQEKRSPGKRWEGRSVAMSCHFVEMKRELQGSGAKKSPRRAHPSQKVQEKSLTKKKPKQNCEDYNQISSRS